MKGGTGRGRGRGGGGCGSTDLGRRGGWAWPEGRGRISRARTHVEITEVQAAGGSDRDHNYDRAAAVTVVAAAVAGPVGAVAVVWHASRRAVSAEQLAPLVAALAQGQAPVPPWLGCVARPAGARGVATRAPYPLLGAESAVAARPLPVAPPLAVARAPAVSVARMMAVRWARG